MNTERKRPNKFLRTVLVASACLISLAPLPAFAQSTAPAETIDTMVTSLKKVGTDAMPIAIGVTGFSVGALLVKRVLYA